MEVVILKNNYIYEIFWKYKIQKREFNIYTYILVHALFSFYIIYTYMIIVS